jgi:protein-tyrosine phosphatase
MNPLDIDFKVLSTATIVFLPERNLEKFDCELLLNKKHQTKNYNYNDQISVLNLSKNKFKNLKLYNLIYLKKLILSENSELETIELVNCYNLDHLDISECKSLKNLTGLEDCVIRIIECENTQIDFLKEKNNSNITFIRDLEQIQHVIDNVYIGNSKHSEEELISLGITHVFNISNNRYREYKTIKETQFKMEDHIDENIMSILPNIIDNIKLLNDSGSKIFVHCFAGISRSATVVLYYIMFFHNYSYNAAFQFLRSKRVGIQPNHGFIRQLKSLEKKFVIVKHEISPNNYLI